MERVLANVYAAILKQPLQSGVDPSLSVHG
jgi:hypothetical protein